MREPQRASVDVQLAATIAHGVAQRDLEPERFERFERLASVELFDPELPECVSQLALAAWFTRQRQMGRVALSSDARVPLDVVRGAQLQRGKMLKVLEYWLEDDAEIAAELAMIRAGAGHLDVANDLEAVADLYQRPAVRVVIAEDRKHYDAADQWGHCRRRGRLGRAMVLAPSRWSRSPRRGPRSGRVLVLGIA